MKTKGLCGTCDNNVNCVLTAENGVLECEEFFAGKKLICGKVIAKSKQACFSTSAADEELLD
ncbi:MAG: hypothetical protein M0R20_07430 [Candidatus Omnitrophica bacterium]|jgi:hypothetical protein|nr:hypothetical protein [Candidatus Omnitrophota bacterium]